MSGYVAQSLFTFFFLVLLATVTWIFGRRKKHKPAEQIQLIEKLILSQRHTVYMIRIRQDVFVIGASEHHLSTLATYPSPHPHPSPEQTEKEERESSLSSITDMNTKLDATAHDEDKKRGDIHDG